MKERKHINMEEITQMIDDWYAGTTDESRDAILFAYFTDTPSDEIPDDLKAEAEVFSMLSLKGMQFKDEELLGEIETEIRREKRSHLWKKVLKYSVWVSSAACISALVIGLSQIKISGNLEQNVQVTTKVEEEPVITKSADSTVVVPSAVASDKVAVNNVARVKRSSKSRVREVTDVKEAQAILMAVDKSLKRTLSAGFGVVDDIEAQIFKSEEITKQVLNNISI